MSSQKLVPVVLLQHIGSNQYQPTEWFLTPPPPNKNKKRKKEINNIKKNLGNEFCSIITMRTMIGQKNVMNWKQWITI